MNGLDMHYKMVEQGPPCSVIVPQAELFNRDCARNLNWPIAFDYFKRNFCLTCSPQYLIDQACQRFRFAVLIAARQPTGISAIQLQRVRSVKLTFGYARVSNSAQFNHGTNYFDEG